MWPMVAKGFFRQPKNKGKIKKKEKN